MLQQTLAAGSAPLGPHFNSSACLHWDLSSAREDGVLSDHSPAKSPLDLGTQSRRGNFVALLATHGESLTVESFVMHAIEACRP